MNTHFHLTASQCSRYFFIIRISFHVESGSKHFHRKLGGFYNKRTYSIFFDREISFTVENDLTFIFGKSLRI